MEVQLQPISVRSSQIDERNVQSFANNYTFTILYEPKNNFLT